MYTLVSEPQGIGKTIDSGFKLYFASFKSVILLALVMGIVSAATQIVMPQSSFDPGSQVAPQMTPADLGLVILFSLLSLILTASVIAKIGAVAHGSSMSLGSALGRGLKAFFPLLLATIMYSIALSIGFILLVIPGLILMLSLIFYSYVIVLDKQGPYSALKTSHNLVWGNWWRTALLLTIVFVIFYVLLLGLTFSLGAGVPLLMSMSENEIMNITNIVYAIVYALFTPLMLSLFVVIYYDLKTRKGGADLAAKIEATA